VREVKAGSHGMIVMPWARHSQANGKTHGTQTVPWLPVAIFRGEVSSPLFPKSRSPSADGLRYPLCGF